ncbi:hypothetical protein BRADI_3g12242v3 [Brachypodium distachyon]|uniref:Uncharacterized protein n=1 Tax=Brachypodium distachyon TaxID=15368 RepID=A0A2K2CWR0_BRADI|nr:hypothetical protein BRADI_3g12242v3 [Brachypodium distachyon]
MVESDREELGRWPGLDATLYISTLTDEDGAAPPPPPRLAYSLTVGCYACRWWPGCSCQCERVRIELCVGLVGRCMARFQLRSGGKASCRPASVPCAVRWKAVDCVQLGSILGSGAFPWPINALALRRVRESERWQIWRRQPPFWWLPMVSTYRACAGVASTLLSRFGSGWLAGLQM